MQEQEHSVHDSVELRLRVPLEKEIPVTIAQETEKKGRKLTDSEDEFPEITEVNYLIPVPTIVIFRNNALEKFKT